MVTSSQLLPQARVAIDYYQRLLRQERVFDRLYVCGWDSMFQLGYHEAGRGDQRNPPLPPELLAALGAADFLTLASDQIAQTEPLVAARRSATSFGWQDLPVREDLADKLYDQLGGAMRFALWWKYRVEPAIDDRGIFGIRIGWLKRLAAGTDWAAGTPQARIRINDYADGLLRWASAMRLFSKTAVGEFSLWNGERLWVRSDLSRPADPIDLHAARSEDETARDLEALLVPKDRNAPPVKAEIVFKDLNETAASGAHEGLGKLVAGVHRATRPFRTGE